MNNTEAATKSTCPEGVDPERFNRAQERDAIIATAKRKNEAARAALRADRDGVIGA